jgi:hypothetical protein
VNPRNVNKDEDGTPITTIGVTTADRPEPLVRCLRSLIPQVRGRAVRIIVVDGSKVARNESLNRSNVKSIARSADLEITYIARSERQAIRKALRSVCPGRLLDFALTPGASGNRNTAILLGSGENVLLVDDDVVCDLWKVRSFRNAIDVCGHVERREIAFFKTRASARRGMIHATTNLLDAHRVLLGRSLESLSANDTRRVDTTRACRFLVEGLTGVRRVVVRTTFSGLTGDAGASNPERLLFGTRKWKDLLQSSRDVYDTAFTYREVRRVASRYLVTHDSGCMGFCMGLANTAMVPPFLPTGRNEDGLFGLTLTAVDRTAVGGHVPYAVLHDSTRPAGYGKYAFVSATQTRVADLMIHLVNSWTPSTKAAGPRQRLARLANWLGDLADLDDAEFARMIVGAIFNARQRELTAIAEAFRPESNYPDYWQRDLRRYRDTLWKSLRKPEFFVPVELTDGRSPTLGLRKVRQFIRLSSELLQVWPTLWADARRQVNVV